jgi:hypothetical protein
MTPESTYGSPMKVRRWGWEPPFHAAILLGLEGLIEVGAAKVLRSVCDCSVSGWALETSPKLSHDSLKDDLVVRNGANNGFLSSDEGPANGRSAQLTDVSSIARECISDRQFRRHSARGS